MKLIERFKELVEYFTPIKEPATVFTGGDAFEELKWRLTHFNAKMFALDSYDVSIGFLIKIDPMFGNIEAYTKVMNHATYLIRKKTPLPVVWGNENSGQVTLDRFLLTADNTLQDKEEAVTNLLESGLSLCKAIEDSRTEEGSHYDHNHRVMNRLFLNLNEALLTIEQGVL